MKKRVIPLMAVILITSVILVFSFYDFIFQNWPYIPHFDMRTQYRQYFAEFERLIMNAIEYNVFPFWSWNFFLGNNFWASKSFHLLGDIFAYLSLFIDAHVYNRVLLVTLMKFLLSTVTFYLYLEHRNKSFKVRLIGALSYSFSSFILRFTELPYFMTFYALIPVYLIGLENILLRKRPYLFIILTTLLLITNYYLFYTLTIFSVIYYIFRVIELKLDFKTSISKFMSFILFYLIGAGLTMFIILPTFFYIIENPRIGNLDFNFWTYPALTNYLNIMTSFLLPMPSMLSSVFVSQYYNFESYIWAGSLFAL